MSLLYVKKSWQTSKHSREERLNAIFYALRASCQGADLPPWKSVYSQLFTDRFKILFISKKII
ncbi:hypothetical protein NEOC65_001442 [Neochlamydia sp. AcF65]|nr:hypothetical protein [Neochlamydia sp. AcF65]